MAVLFKNRILLVLVFFAHVTRYLVDVPGGGGLSLDYSSSGHSPSVTLIVR
jgi:hypothetical protein